MWHKSLKAIIHLKMMNDSKIHFFKIVMQVWNHITVSKLLENYIKNILEELSLKYTASQVLQNHINPV